ncbi:MAG: hypothetical protein EBR82_14290 [Caulobacteraceae bacterium]|nr:hypothetical protein [Caulobacteraceae bacterium]
MSNVNFLTGVFHPQYTFDTTNGVQMRLDTSLDGNVTMGDSSTNYSLTIDGIYITGSGGTLQISSDVYLGGGLIASNILLPTGNIAVATGNITAGGNLLVEGTSRFGGDVNIGDLTTSYALLVNGLPVALGRDVSRWADYPAKNNVDLSGYSITSSTGGITLSGCVYALGNIAIPSGNIVLASGDIAVGGSLIVEGATRLVGPTVINDVLYAEGGIISSNISVPIGNILLASGNIVTNGTLFVGGSGRFDGNVNIGDLSTNYTLTLNGVSLSSGVSSIAAGTGITLSGTASTPIL